MDFYCPKLQLAIEIDGDSHFLDGRKQYDERRAKFIQSFGIKLLRFTNHEIYYNLYGVLEKIKNFQNLPSPLL